MNKKILVSLSVIGLVAAIAISGTIAFFSDTETSTGNTFTAGAIDLKIDSECHWSGGEICPWHGLENPDKPGKIMLADWTESDLIDGVHKFFYFTDLKPGDWGEDTISIHVIDNDAWGRIYFSNVKDLDNTCTEPEGKDEMKGDPNGDGPTAGCDNDGELDNEMEAMVWLDQGMIPGFQGKCIDPTNNGCIDPWEGDNLWQGLLFEPVIVYDDITADWSYALANIISTAYGMTYPTDSAEVSCIDPNSCPGLTEDGHLVGCVTYYIGVGWCFGDWVYDPGTGTGSCNGSNIDNTSQTDSLSGDITFEVEQYRHQAIDPFQTVGYWHFDENTGTIASDSSGMGNHGAITDAAWIPGKHNSALSFDGVGDYVNCGNDASLKPTYVTLEAWVKSPSSPGSYRYIAGKYYGSGWGSYNLYTGSSGGLQFYTGSAGGYIASPVATAAEVWDGSWHHIAGTYDGSTVKLYVDGSEISGGTGTIVGIECNDQNFYIGSYGAGYYFNGLIDEVRVYNRALSNTEISDHYNSGM